jgi:hypothetical protein
MRSRAKIEARASIVIAASALFFALGGTSYAVLSQINGASLKNRSVAGIKLKRGTLNGTEIDVAHLPRVPSARQAVQASSALYANTAASAASLTGTLAGAKISGPVASATTAQTAATAQTAIAAQTATTAANAANATNAANVDGHTFAQIDASSGISGEVTLLSAFGGLTLECYGPSGTGGTVILQVVNSSSATGTFAASAVDGGSSAQFDEGAVEPATGSTPVTTSFDFQISNGAEVTFSDENTTGSAPEIVTGTVTLTIDNGCSAFGNAEAS